MADQVEIRMLVTVTGSVHYAAGAVVLVSDELAKDLVNAGHAQYTTTPKKPEKAVSQAAAKAEKR